MCLYIQDPRSRASREARRPMGEPGSLDTALGPCPRPIWYIGPVPWAHFAHWVYWAHVPGPFGANLVPMWLLFDEFQAFRRRKVKKYKLKYVGI